MFLNLEAILSAFTRRMAGYKSKQTGVLGSGSVGKMSEFLLQVREMSKFTGTLTKASAIL